MKKIKNNSIKILVVFHNSMLESGATKSLTDILNNLITNNIYKFDVVFPSSTGSAIDYYRSKNIKVFNYQYGKLMQNLNQSLIKRIIKFPLLLYRYINIIREAKKASKELKSNNYDIVYSNTSSIIFGALLGKYMKCKHIWHIREFRKKDHQIYFFLGEKRLKKFINKYSNKVLFVSQKVMDDNIDFIDYNKCIVTYNSYSKDFIHKKEKFNMNEKLNVLIAGDIQPSKGQFDIVKAIAFLNNDKEKFKLHIAGNVSINDYYQKILKFIDDNNMKDQVTFYGHVKDMKSLRKNMDIGVVSSTCEAFGRTTIEGMLSMLAMIGRDSGGTTEQIDNNVTGLLYDGTVNDLVDKLLLFYNDRKKMKEIAINGFENAIEEYTNGQCYKKVEQAIYDVMNTMCGEIE
ncbi:MAG: glycosyltransferase family 4 protein [Bacilli bacterium]|nr:glycosyltransferase family 4 protein [Bacilli bacterium]